MKKLIHTVILLNMAMFASSCWSEDIPEAGAARHEVTDLAATPGDEEVQLSWSMPEGWNPTDYIIFYTDENSETITKRTDGAKTYVVDGLMNGTTYNFNVQAVYGSLISNAVSVSGQPTTSRLPVTDLFAVETGDAYVKLQWTTPSTTLLSYTLSYYMSDSPDNVTDIPDIPKETTEYTCERLTNDENYYFLLTAVYEKGNAEAASVRAMPTKAVPYFLSSEVAAVGQPITFEFNREGYPDAEDVTWIFPDDARLTGDKILSGLSATGSQTVILSAKINGSERRWNIIVEIRDYVVYYNQWINNGNYESPTYTCPVLSPDIKTVYVNTGVNTSNLYAFDVQTGTLKWTFSPETLGDNRSSSTSMIAVNPVTGDIYYGTGTAGQFYAVSPDGTKKWSFTKAGSMNSAPPVISADGGTVYIVDAAGKLFAIDAGSGSEKWSAPYEAGEAGYGLLINGSEVVVGSASRIHFVNAANGSAIAKIEDCSCLNYTGFAVSPDKQLAYFSTKKTLSAIDLNNHTLLYRSTAGGDNYYQPIVAGNGIVFAGTKDGYVRFFTAELALIREEQPSFRTSSTFNFSRPCVDADNRFYIVAAGNSSKSFASLVLVYNNDGTLYNKWDYTELNAQNGCNLADGVLYTVNQGSNSDGLGLFIGKYIGAERGKGWSSHGGDHCGSGCIQSPQIEW